MSATFHQHLGTEEGNNDPQYLTEAARQHLRKKFIGSQLAITGVNFAVAETGGFVVGPDVKIHVNAEMVNQQEAVQQSA